MSIALVLLSSCNNPIKRYDKYGVNTNGHQSKLGFGPHYNVILATYTTLRKADQKEIIEAINFVDHLISNGSLEKQKIAADLSYLLMTLDTTRPFIVRYDDLLNALTNWSLSNIYLGQDHNIPLQEAGHIDLKYRLVKPYDLLVKILAVTKSTEQSQDIYNLIGRDLEKNKHDADYILKINVAVEPYKIPKLNEYIANLLIDAVLLADEKGSESIVNAIIKSENHSLLKSLIEMSVHRRASYTVAKYAMDHASDRSFDLGLLVETLPSMRRVLSSTSAYTQMKFRALRWAWEFGTKDDLKDTLRSITPHFQEPFSSTIMKKEVHNFCMMFVIAKKDDVRKPLLELLAELKDQTKLWPTRLYTMYCSKKLYPNDFLRVMKKNHLFKKYYQTDQTLISGWRSDRKITLGEIAGELMTEDK